MKNQLRILLFVCLWALGVTAFAQLDKKAQSTLKKATGKLDNAEKTMAYGKEMLDKIVAENKVSNEMVERSEKKTNDAEAKTKEAEEILGTLDASASEVKEAKARVVKLYADANAERKRYEQMRAKVAADNSVWESADVEGMQALMEKLATYASEVRAPRDPNKEILQSWPQLIKDTEAVLSKYEGVRATSREAQRIQIDLKNLQDQYEDTIRDHNNALTDIPKEIEESLTRAKGFAQEAIDKGTFGQFIHVVRPEISQLEDYLTIYAVISSGATNADTKLVEKTRASINELKALQTKHEAKIIESNKAPEDVYQGADKSKLVSLITDETAKVNKGQKVLGVKIVETDWSRETGEKWNSSSLSWEKYDQSLLNAAVLVSSPDGKYAYIYNMTIYKKHMQNDKLILSFYKLSGKPEMPSDILLITNAK